MVSTLSLIGMCTTLLLSLILPVIVLMILLKGRKGVFGIWVAGALGFIIPQLVIRIPILQALGNRPAYQEFTRNYPVLTILLLALTAGLFETTGRLLVLKTGLSKQLSYMTGLAAGAGHGGIEAIALIGMTYVNNLIISIFINTGNLTTIIPDNPELAESVRQTLLATKPELFFMAGFERVSTMLFHIALSVILAWLILNRHAVLGFILVAAAHFALDFIMMLLQQQGVSIWLIEGAMLAVGLFSLILTIKIRSSFGASLSIPADPGEQAVKEGY